VAKIIFYTDTHFGNSGDFSHPSSSGYSTRLDYTMALHQWVLDLVTEHEPDIIINGGDLYKSQGTIEAKAISACTVTMTNMAEKVPNIPHYVLLGNHDFITTDRSVSSIDWLEKLPPFILIKETQVVDLPSYDLSLVLCPYYHDDSEALRDVLAAAKLCRCNKKMFFGHLNLRGVVESVTRTPGGFSEYKLDKGDSKDFVDCKTLSSLFDYSFNGHHHVPQQPFSNVILPGSLQQFTVTEFDYNMRRGVWLIDTDKNTTRLIPNMISPRISKVFSLKQLDSLEDNCYVIYNHIDQNENRDVINSALKRFISTRVLSPSGVSPTLASNSLVDSIAGAQHMSSVEHMLESYMDSIYKDSPELKQMSLDILNKAKSLL
jgi:DNA repair exonuclease SbcCD nuclease subunit